MITLNGHEREVNIMLYDGSWEGVLHLDDSSWNLGELYSAPRESIRELLDIAACSKKGVYLLLSNDRVYVGQSIDLARRLKEHLSGKDWWTSAVFLTTKDNSLNLADITYLEGALIDRAMHRVEYDSDNKNRGQTDTVSDNRRRILNQYLAKALDLLEFIGVSAFFSGSSKSPNGKAFIDTLNVSKRLAQGKRTKSEAINYLKERGIPLGKASKCTFSTFSDQNAYYWMNPNTSLLSKDWSIVLNDTQSLELVVLQIPADTFSLASDSNDSRTVLFTRSDKPWQIDLHLQHPGLVDTRSGVDFSQFIIARVSYAQ